MHRRKDERKRSRDVKRANRKKNESGTSLPNWTLTIMSDRVELKYTELGTSNSKKKQNARERPEGNVKDEFDAANKVLLDSSTPDPTAEELGEYIEVNDTRDSAVDTATTVEKMFIFDEFNLHSIFVPEKSPCHVTIVRRCRLESTEKKGTARDLDQTRVKVFSLRLETKERVAEVIRCFAAMQAEAEDRRRYRLAMAGPDYEQKEWSECHVEQCPKCEMKGCKSCANGPEPGIRYKRWMVRRDTRLPEHEKDADELSGGTTARHMTIERKKSIKRHGTPESKEPQRLALDSAKRVKAPPFFMDNQPKLVEDLDKDEHGYGIFGNNMAVQHSLEPKVRVALCR